MIIIKWQKSITKCFFAFISLQKILIPFFFFIAALAKAISLCVDQADVSTVCGEVDSFIEAELLKYSVIRNLRN